MSGRLLGGVCAGLAVNLQVDVTLVRLGFLLLALASGLGVVVYGAMWLLLPDALDDRPASRRLRERTRTYFSDFPDRLRRSGDALRAGWVRAEQHPWPRPMTRRWIGLGLVIGGAAIFLASIGLFAWLDVTRAIGLAAIVFGGAVLLSVSPGRRA